MTYEITSTGSDETEQFGRSLGSKVRGGEVFLLVSDLGGGKTALTRGLAAGMGSPDHVASPTFTISREYKAGKLTLYHFDFYRLPDPGVVAAELEEFLHDPRAVIAIEWGNVVEDVLPAERVTISLKQTGESSRLISAVYPEKLAYLFPKVPAGAPAEQGM